MDQLGIRRADGPRVSISLLEPRVDDPALQTQRRPERQRKTPLRAVKGNLPQRQPGHASRRTRARTVAQIGLNRAPACHQVVDQNRQRDDEQRVNEAACRARQEANQPHRQDDRQNQPENRYHTRLLRSVPRCFDAAGPGLSETWMQHSCRSSQNTCAWLSDTHMCIVLRDRWHRSCMIADEGIIPPDKEVSDHDTSYHSNPDALGADHP
jgi:hypothetical protein